MCLGEIERLTRRYTSEIAEVIGPALKPGGLSGFQYYGKGRAVLIR